MTEKTATEKQLDVELALNDIMRLVDAHRNLRWTVISQLNESRQAVEDAVRAALEKK